MKSKTSARAGKLRNRGAKSDYQSGPNDDIKGGPHLVDKRKAIQREREKLHEMTDSHQCFKPIPVLIGELNRHLKGWANYFSVGYPMGAYCEIERYVQGRLIQHLERRSQRPYRPPEGESWLRHLGRLGLIRLSALAHV